MFFFAKSLFTFERQSCHRTWAIVAGLSVLFCTSVPSIGQCSRIGSVTASFVDTCEVEAVVIVTVAFGFCGNGACQGVACSLHRDSPTGPLIGWGLLYECAGPQCCWGRSIPYTWRPRFSIPSGLPIGTHLYAVANDCRNDCTTPVPHELVYYGGGATPQPGNLRASRNRCVTILLQWNEVAGATRYRITRQQLPFPGITGSIDIPAPASSYTDSNIDPGTEYAYWMTATRPCGGDSLQSDLALGHTLGMPVQVQGIEVSPPLGVCVGGSAAIQVRATGTDLEYTWYQDDVEIYRGVGAYALVISGVGLDSAGSYRCTVSNPCGSADSASVSLFVHLLPVPLPGQDQQKCIGDRVDMPATGIEFGSRYLWRKGGQPIPGPEAQQNIYTILSVTESSRGAYDCEVTNDCGTITTPVWNIDVRGNCLPPHDASQGTNDNFIGPEPASPRASLPSAAQTFFGVSSTQVFGFDVIPDGGGGNNRRRIFTHSFTALPSDTVAGTLTLHLQAASSNSNPLDDTVRLGFADATANGGIPGFWSIPLTTLNGGVIWSNGTQLTRTLDLAALPSGGSGPTNLIAGINANGFLDIIVEDRTGVDYVTINLDRQQPGFLPWVASQPQDATTCLGGQRSFSVTGNAAGAPFTYQWRKGGMPLSNVVGHISGTTTATVTITGATCADAAAYSCVLTNCCGMATSGSVALSFCIGDANCSGRVTVQDIFDFLGFYFGGDARADVNCVGGVSLQDIFDFLIAYFSGC